MDDKKEKKFISERILGRELTLRRAVKYIFLSLLCGLVFGGAFFGVCYFAKIQEEKRTEKEEQRMSEEAAELKTEEQTAGKKAEESLTQAIETKKEIASETEPEAEQETEPEMEAKEIASEETETGKAADAGSEKAAGPEESKSEKNDPENEETAENIEETMPEESGQDGTGGENVQEILQETGQTGVCKAVSPYIVKVSCTISGTTWFESTVETVRYTSGIIMDVSEEEVLVLTVKTAVSENGSYHVIFSDGTKQEAVVKQVAVRDGWAMFAVSASALGKEFARTLKSVTVAPAEDLSPGTSVITAGSPMGICGSYGFGYLNYIGEEEGTVDGCIVRCYTQATSRPEAGTFLMSEEGKLIGFGVAKEEEESVDGNCFILADSCSLLLESLKKGYDQARLGITGQNISFEMKYNNIPAGLYVVSVEEDSPAEKAGLRRGDIIVKIGARDITSLSDFCSFMRNLRPEETVTMTVKREGVRFEYKDVELTLTADVRQ